MRTLLTTLVWAGLTVATHAADLPYRIVSTNQQHCYDDRGRQINPQRGDAFFGQDAQNHLPPASYKDHGDGTVSDLVTGLMWVKTPDFANRKTWAEARAGAKDCKVGGHTDWRLPTIKELYSLIDFNGYAARGAQESKPYLNTRFFDFQYPDASSGLRLIDAQYWSSTEYVGTTMDGNATAFGVNFADGRIKGYPKSPRGREMRRYVRYVRGNALYGKNDFVDNKDGTITDRATGLMWTKADSGKTLNWQEALAWAAKLTTAGHKDWRLPSAKELQSIVDYTRAPDATDQARRGPALDPRFGITQPESYFWTATTHLDGPLDRRGSDAVYVAFGRAMGLMRTPGGGEKKWMNVHGAGAQRSDPKAGNPKDPRFAAGQGPQGDDRRIYNYARAVRVGS